MPFEPFFQHSDLCNGASLHQAIITNTKHAYACAFPLRLQYMCAMLSGMCRKFMLGLSLCACHLVKPTHTC